MERKHCNSVRRMHRRRTHWTSTLDVQWVPLASQEQLDAAVSDQDNYLVRIQGVDREVLPLGMWTSLAVYRKPVLLAAAERGLLVELAHVVNQEAI